MNRSLILATAFAAAFCSLATPARAGLIGYYTFEGNANDVSGNGRHGTVSAPAPTATAPGGGFTGWGDATSQAFSFGAGGTDTFVTVPIDLNPSALPQVTFGAWVKASDLSDVIRGIISHDDGGFDRTLDLDTRGGVDGTPQWCMFTGAGGNCSAAITSDWTFVAVRYDANLAQAQLSVNDLHSAVIPSTNGTSVHTVTTIGRNPGFDLPFVGLIDNAFFFDAYLSDAQLSDVYRNGITVPEPVTMVLLGAGLFGIAARRRRA